VPVNDKSPRQATSTRKDRQSPRVHSKLRVPAAKGAKFRRKTGNALVNRGADTTTVRESRSVLRLVSQHLIKSQEEERRRIACELHDEIGQQLTCLKSMLVRDAGLVAGKPQALELVNELIGQVRNIAVALRPSLLDDFGLLPALTKLFERYTVQSGIEVDFVSQGIDGTRFVGELETAAFRIIQEALTNAARHASVASCVVRLWLTNEEYLNVQVEDGGRGFDFHSVSGQTSGLSNMRERARSLGGTFEIHSEFNRGTILQVRIPVKSSEGAPSIFDMRHP
jgi:signal transduction histidine kinase